MRDLASAGSATSARAAVEDRLTPNVTRIVHVFLAKVRQAAYGALDAPVLLAAGRPPFSLYDVASLWQVASGELVEEIARAAGTTRARGDLLSRYERTILGRLGSSPITQDAYTSVRDVLTTSVDQSWPRARTEATLRETLAPTTASYTTTADGLTQSGRTWQGVADGIARTEATAAFANSTLNDLAAAGATSARWVTRHDERVRHTHAQADGQTVPLGEDFIIGGYALAFPGDPNGPAAETHNCRCVLIDGGTKMAGPATPTADELATSLVADATLREPALTELMSSIALDNGGKPVGLDFAVKGPGSLARKINGDVAEKGLTVQEAAAGLFDVNRYTILFPDRTYARSSQAAISELRAAGNQVKVKNFWDVDTNPYQGINMQVTEPSGGRYELQFHTPDSFEVKEGALHTIYEKSRVETDPAKIEEYSRQSFAVAARIPVPRGVTLGSGFAGKVESFRYSPHQPRDYHGRFAGKGMLAASGRYDDLPPKAQATVDSKMAEYGLTNEALDAEVLSVLTPENVAEGKAWYPAARQFNKDLAGRHGLTLEQATGVTAALSPRLPWPQNMKRSELVASRYNEFDPKMDSVEAAKRLGGGLSVQTGVAINIARGAPIDSALTGTKRRSFYNNMLNPGGTDDVTVDTWMMSVGIRAGKTGTQKKPMATKDDAMKWLNASKDATGGGAGYISISESVRRVASQQGMRPDEAQAAYWVGVRGGGEK